MSVEQQFNEWGIKIGGNGFQAETAKVIFDERLNGAAVDTADAENEPKGASQEERDRHRNSDAEGIDELAALGLPRLSTIQSRPIEWLWKPCLAIGKLHSIEGDPGMGKSYAISAIAACVTNGRGLPETAPFEPGDVFLFNREDDTEDTIHPRLHKLGANLDRVRVFSSPLTIDTTSGRSRLRELIKIGRPRLVVIDPLHKYLGKVNMSHTTQMAEIMDSLEEMAREFRCAIVTVRHLAKREYAKTIHQGQGNVTISGSSRSGCLAAVDPDDETRRILYHHKSNNAGTGTAFEFSITPDGSEVGRFEWGKVKTLTPERLLEGGDGGRLAEAVEDLKEILKHGPVPKTHVKSEMDRNGHCQPTYYRAIKAAKLKKLAVNGVKCLSLPDYQASKP